MEVNSVSPVSVLPPSAAENCLSLTSSLLFSAVLLLLSQPQPDPQTCALGSCEQPHVSPGAPGWKGGRLGSQVTAFVPLVKYG